MKNTFQSNQTMAAAITRAGSKQTYYTFRYLVDRPRVTDAYRAYAYFRWLDDQVDQEILESSEQIAFIDHQKALMESLYQGQQPGSLSAEEQMLADLVLSDHEKNSGLQAYIRNMMAVIDFDARRRGRLISGLELSTYSRHLSISVTEAMHYFIGHDQPSPHNGYRYLAVAGAHIVHMLRDTLEDIQAGYFNIPREYLLANGIGPQDVESDAYRAWVRNRADLARAYFKSGKDYLAQVKNIRCRLAGYAYIARFELVLDAFEKVGYRLKPGYPVHRDLGAEMRMGGSALLLAFLSPLQK